MESERSVQLMTPLTARIYLEAYYDLGDPKKSQNLLPLLNEFNAWDVIPVATLQDTWPEGEWEEPESDQADRDEVAVSELEKLEINAPDSSKSLRDGAMAAVLQALLDEADENTALQSEAELLTDFLPKLKEKLYELSNTLKPSHHLLNLLCRALEEEIDVDLSPFKCFSSEDMSLVVSRLRKHGRMQTLCISNRSDLTAEDLQVVLRDATGLKALYVLEDSQIPAQCLSPFFKDCDLYNSDLLRRAIKPERVSLRSDDTMPISHACGDNDISQLLWIGISDQQALDKSHRHGNGLIDWKTLQQEKRRTNFGWSGPGLRYKRYPLDMPLSTSRTVAGLLCLFKWGSSSHVHNVEDFSTSAALSFAMASSIPRDKELKVGPVGGSNELGIGPLASGLYRGSSYERNPTDDVLEHLEPGRWAIVLIHEAYNAMSQKDLDRCQRGEQDGTDSDSEDGNPLRQPKGGEQSLTGMMALLLGPRDPFENKEKNQGLPFRAIKRLRYALVTPCVESHTSCHDFIVADIPTYLEHTVGKNQGKEGDGEFEKLVETWNRRIAAMDTVGFYGDQDIHDILPKVFPKQKAASSSS